jgi:sterol 3beta-glucosyltransferase
MLACFHFVTGINLCEHRCRAGVPQIVLPFIADQHFWAQRIAELGVGTKPLKHKKLSVEQALQAVRTVTQDQAMRKRAGMLGEKVQQERGVEEAVQAFGRAIRTFSNGPMPPR